MGLIAFLISYLMGYYLLRCFKSKDSSLTLMDVFMATGLGLGISSQVVFYALMILDRIDPVFIIQAHLLCLSVLFFFSRRHGSKGPAASVSLLRPAAFVVVILSLAVLMSAVMALKRPWGNWDAWAFWNFHANFLFRSGYEWRRLYEFNVGPHHPWMLPLTIIWGWSCYAAEKVIVPIGIGMIFTVSTLGLLIGALRKYVSFFWAVLGGVFLISIPFYIGHGASQYADIEAAYFILLSLVTTLDLLKYPSAKAALLTGVCLGLSASVKENSIVASILLFVLIILYLNKSGIRVFIRPLSWGFVAVMISVVLMRSFEITIINDQYAAYWPGLWHMQKWSLIGRYIWQALSGTGWGGVWLLTLAVLIAQRSRWTKGGIRVLVQFVILYIVLYLFLYAASAFEIKWLLSVTFDRLLFLLVPSAVFLMFYTVSWQEE